VVTRFAFVVLRLPESELTVFEREKISPVAVAR
jgi:hypothetical protein